MISVILRICLLVFVFNSKADNEIFKDDERQKRSNLRKTVGKTKPIKTNIPFYWLNLPSMHERKESMM